MRFLSFVPNEFHSNVVVFQMRARRCTLLEPGNINKSPKMVSMGSVSQEDCNFETLK